MHRFAFLALMLCGCEPLEAHALSGQYFDQEADCLDAELVIDVVEGKASETCDGVRCFRSEETGDYYVTSACEAPEHYQDLTDSTDGPCVAALHAHDLGDVARCPDGGGGAGGGS